MFSCMLLICTIPQGLANCCMLVKSGHLLYCEAHEIEWFEHLERFLRLKTGTYTRVCSLVVANERSLIWFQTPPKKSTNGILLECIHMYLSVFMLSLVAIVLDQRKWVTMTKQCMTHRVWRVHDLVLYRCLTTSDVWKSEARGKLGTKLTSFQQASPKTICPKTICRMLAEAFAKWWFITYKSPTHT